MTIFMELLTCFYFHYIEYFLILGLAIQKEKEYYSFR